MTPAAALVAELQARGVILRPDGEILRVRPVSLLSPEELATLRAHKAEVLALLTVPAGPAPPEPETLPGVRSWCYPWPVSLPGLGRYHVDVFEVCADCDRGTWSRYGGRPLCFGCARRRARP